MTINVMWDPGTEKGHWLKTLVKFEQSLEFSKYTNVNLLVLNTVQWLRKTRKLEETR